MNPAKSTFLFAFALATVAVAAAAPKLGIQSWTCRNMDFEETVQFAADHGIKYLELYSKHLDPNDDEATNLKKLANLESHGVTAYSMGVSRTTLAKEENRKLFELAKLFGMQVIVVEPGDALVWGNLEELVKEYDIKLAIHNHGAGTTYGNPAVVKHILAKHDHRIGVCLDVGWITAAGFDAESAFRNYGDRVFDMHLKDKRLDLLDDNGRPTDTFIGLGNANYAGLFGAIKESDWDGVMAIETDSAAFAEDPAAFVAAAKAFFEASLAD